MIATAQDRRHDLSSWSGQQRRRCLHRGGGDEEDKCRLFPSPGVDPLSQFLRSLWSRPVPLWYRFPSAHRRARAKEAPVQESQSRRGGPGRKSQVGERTQLSPPPISASLDACSSSWALSQLPLPLPLSLSLSLEIRITRDSERDVLDRMERNQGEKGATAQVRRSSKKKSSGDLRSPPRRRLLSIRERSEQELLLPFFFSTYLPRALQLLDPLIGSRAYFTMVRERRKESTKGTFL